MDNVTLKGEKYKFKGSEIIFTVSGFQCGESEELFDSIDLAKGSSDGQIYVVHNKGNGVHEVERTLIVEFNQ